MKKINPIELGATLFVPAIHKNLKDIVGGSKYPLLKSVLIDTEDGLKKDDRALAFECIQTLLQTYKREKLFVFIRPLNIETLKNILTFKNIEEITGFILPKFSLQNAQEYLEILAPLNFAVMPSIEGEELFNHNRLNDLRDILLPFKEEITLVRFGLEDILKTLRLRRDCKISPFDISTTSAILGNFIATFKSSGFSVSGGVYPCFKDVEGFIKDVKRDLIEGLISKTIIHPNQIELLSEQYRVTKEEFDNAMEICMSQEAVFAQGSNMAEVVTMTPYSQEIVLRAETYGLI